MTITLPKELEALVNKGMENGAYRTPEEMIRAGLRLLEAREKGMDALRSEIMLGLNDIEQGRVTTCETDAELDDFAKNTIQNAETESDSLASR